MSIQNRLREVKERIEDALQKAGRAGETVTIVGATKGVGVDRIREAYRAGITIFGENRVQEAIPKIQALREYPITWHMIGHLQRNKAQKACTHFHLIQSVDSWKLAQHLERVCTQLEQVMPVFVEVNIGKEITKTGVAPEEAEELIHWISEQDHLRVRGLMAIPPYHPDPEKVRPYFKKMKSLFDDLSSRYRGLEHLSMGMSEDYWVAVEEGATMIRLGRVLFGPRK